MPSPQRFGRYVLKELKAKGGMAEIFDAEMVGAEGFSKRVALKRTLPHLSEDPSFTAMFLDEARLASKLSHPNVVQVFDFGEVEGRYYIAMEWLDGESLSTLVRAARSSGRQLPQRVVLQIMAAAADGLHHAHTFVENGQPLQVVHRDISPSNIMVTLQGGVKVLDFGIARAANRQQDATETGIVKGKVPYCSPEQLRGDNLDARSDVFSLGIVLWELLCGTWLFRREKQLETVMAVLEGPVPPPSTVRKDLDPRIDAVVARALERSVTKRTQSAAELRRDLEALMSGPPVRLDEFMAELLAAGPAKVEPVAAPAVSGGQISVDVNLETGFVPPPQPQERATPASPASLPVAAPAATPRKSVLPQVVMGLGVVTALIFGAVLARGARSEETATPMVDAGVARQAETVPTVEAGVALHVETAATADAGVAAMEPLTPTLSPLPQGEGAPDAGKPRVVTVKLETPKPPKKEPPVAKKPPAEPGLLDVSCAPWCRILVDGKDVGQVSPLVGFSLPVGKHSLKVEHPPSGHSSEKQLDVAAGARLKETFNLR